MPRKGPTPKRSGERRRRNAGPGTAKLRLDGAVVIPAAPGGLHPIAADWYRALGESGQSKFYEPSDWQRAKVVALKLSQMLEMDAPPATMIAAVFTAMDSVMDSESARRRSRIEVQRLVETPAADSKVTAMAELRRKLG
jgi:hypothetical protein